MPQMSPQTEIAEAGQGVTRTRRTSVETPTVGNGTG